MMTLSPLGMPEVLPALVVGYELTGEAIEADVLSTPPWLIRLDQQAGGYVMSYPSVFGAVLRLEANLDRGRNHPAELVRGFNAMAEDPDMATLESFPALRALVQTQGGDYRPEELQRLSSFVTQFFDVPSFESGLEAFVKCVGVDPIAWCGWRVFSCRAADGAEPFEDIDDYVLHTRRPDLVLADDLTFDAAMAERLRDTARDIARFVASRHLFKQKEIANLEREPRTFLLWENSD